MCSNKNAIFYNFGGENRAGCAVKLQAILPAVKSCRDGTDRDLRFWIYPATRHGRAVHATPRQAIYEEGKESRDAR